MNLIETLIGKLQNHPKRFVFTDGEDARVLQAARQIVTRQMGAPMLIGDRARIKDKAAKLGIVTKGIRIIEPERSSELDQFVEDLKALPKYSNLSDEEIFNFQREDFEHDANFNFLGLIFFKNEIFKPALFYKS